jgi:hypothetical protein
MKTQHIRRRAWLALTVLGVIVATFLAMPSRVPAATASPTPAATSTASRPVPLLAYYYIWFNPSSWNRVKKDYPLLGRYSSNDVTVMGQQVSLAKQAGISGFLVSWKDTNTLDSRLAALVKVATAADFKLGIVFQGLDFHRRPLPMAEVQRSFAYLAKHYTGGRVFDLFSKPVVIWAGTPSYTRDQLASITNLYRSRFLILAAEKQTTAYESVSDLFDGNAYYWSSADPLGTPGYREKLDSFSFVVHLHGGLWFAPAAPGFDAQLLGGSSMVPRRDGATLTASMNAAMGSSPDAIGLISWNEYSENTMVEPSRIYGSNALKVIAGIQHANPATIPDFDSSSPSGFRLGAGQFVILGGVVLIMLGSAWTIVTRRTRHGH